MTTKLLIEACKTNDDLLAGLYEVVSELDQAIDTDYWLPLIVQARKLNNNALDLIEETAEQVTRSL